jgi:hypothetical protein
VGYLKRWYFCNAKISRRGILEKQFKMKGANMEVLVLILGVAIGTIIGVAIGIFVGTERMRKAIEDQSVGDLRIDRSEPDEPPRPFLEIMNGCTIETISQKKFVILKVNNENYISSN